MARTPNYVRLNDSLAAFGSQHDIDSGFGVSGFDVVKVPDKDENPGAVRWVKRMLNRGILEEASKAEYDEVRESNPDLGQVDKVMLVTDPRQLISEADLRRNIQSAGKKVAKRIQSRLEEAEDDDDDDEVITNRAGDAQRATPAERRAAKKAGTGKKGGNKRSRSTSNTEDEESEETEETTEEETTSE